MSSTGSSNEGPPRAGHGEADGFPDDVRVVRSGGRDFYVVGTAHVSRESADLVRSVIEKVRPDRVCVELDRRRYDALRQGDRWENLDLKAVIRQKQLATLLVNVVLSAYQRRLGVQVGVIPGTELLEATRVAEELDIPVAFCDRDVRVTLGRAWRLTPFFRKILLLGLLTESVFDRTEVSEETLRDLRSHDSLSEMLREMGEAMPSLKRVLIDERDAFLTHRIIEEPGDRVVVVVGAGHAPGIARALKQQQQIDPAPISEIPPGPRLGRVFGWAVPLTILGALGMVGWLKGAEAAGHNAMYWILANGIPSSIGAALAGAHPVTVLSAFVAAPITSLTPVIGAGYVTALVQTYLRPPLVHDFERVGDDVHLGAAWWRNRLLRVFLVFLLPGLGSMIGTWVGGYEIVSNLF